MKESLEADGSFTGQLNVKSSIFSRKNKKKKNGTEGSSRKVFNGPSWRIMRWQMDVIRLWQIVWIAGSV